MNTYDIQVTSAPSKALGKRVTILGFFHKDGEYLTARVCRRGNEVQVIQRAIATTIYGKLITSKSITFGTSVLAAVNGRVTQVVNFAPVGENAA